MSETSNQDHRLASESSPLIVNDDGREGTDPKTGGSGDPAVQVTDPPKDPDWDNQ